MNTFRRILAGLSLGIAGLGITAVAQAAEKKDAAPALKAPDVPWIPIVYAILMLIATAVIGFKNARRTHLD